LHHAHAAPHRFRTEPRSGLETANGIEQAEHAVLHQIVDLYARRQTSHQMTGDAPDQRREALDKLILVELTSSVIHAFRRELSGVDSSRVNALAPV
jgi:hypothetical protein